ncbi:MAG: dynamin family protein [Phascolarctobacterium sp.]|uniref:dynamin family protein n=1 Tax=Phascolarctobacterium sp. TaxID=2049039 RepID=UPI0026DB8D00|nr:dynamin family protein [Phascolarctobacterium sp.]MDO4921346.1 dynamin family protein [Phascolarctobacterium sp.]
MLIAEVKDVIAGLQTVSQELGKQQLAKYAAGLDEIIKHTEEPLMLMVMGSFSTGKSSFINALVGEEIAAVEAKPTTAVVTKLCYGAQDKLTVYFRNGDSKVYSPAEFSRLTAVNDDAQQNVIHASIDYVERQMPIEILRQVSIIDSPGLNDVNEQHSAATEAFVNKADTVLWMFSSMQAASRKEVAAMDRLTPRLKPIAVVNKMDLIDEEEDDPQEFLAKIEKTLQGKVQAVIGISAKYAWEGQKENNALKKQIGNLSALNEAIMTLVVPHRDVFKLNTLLDELGYYFNDFNKYFAAWKEENARKKDVDYAAYIASEQQILQIEEILGTAIATIQDYCEREAGRRNEQALFLLGVLYDGGIGVLQNTDKALDFYQKAALKKHEGALINMYRFYKDGGNADKAEYWLKVLAEQGNPRAQNEYGSVLETREKTEEACSWYAKAAEQGLAAAQYNLGRCYYDAVGTERDMAAALQWFGKSAEQRFAAAQYAMGRYYASNAEEKFAWYQKAAEQGYAEAQNWVGRYLEKGWGGVIVNKSEAVEWYRKAAEQGLAIAQMNLADCLFNGMGVAVNKGEAYKWYRKAAEQGDANAQYMVGSYLEEGGGGITVDEEEAVEWYRKAAEQGQLYAQCNLADCLFDGMGVAVNKGEAYKWYRKAAEQGDANAQYMVGSYLEEGGGGITVDEEEAVEWYRKAAEQGQLYAQYNLARCLNYGIGVEANGSEAVKWYKKSAEQGYDDAQYMLAKYYEEGAGGIAVNKAEAYRWYKKAAEQGHIAAQEKVAEYLEQGTGNVPVNKEAAAQWRGKAQTARASQSSGCLLPILGALVVLALLAIF